ncbi:unnamed protein product [Urochloa decumbens]|uniref:DUF4220 domain-containing protein n=1 Tax=Urochloa decumbens TaxID=240449 RepID=A0ABC8YXP3_9POAL
MADGGLLHLWSEWGIQIMVVASFALQVLLLACGGTRRHSSSTVLKIILWLAYLSADSTAIYTLGHLSVASSSREHLLVAFWAPFLLLYLGGPDNITAYALEDNRLWLRHLQTLAVQVLGAAYVVYKFIFSGHSHDDTLLLLAASVSMFAAGLAKYGERVWALKCGNITSITSSFDKLDGNVRFPEPLNQLPRDGGEIGKEEILLGAHSHFDICKGAFTDATMKVHGSSGSNTVPSESMIADLYKLVEMELSLMYDILYTKAAVIHTWYGICIHSISLLGTVAAFLLFQLSIGSNGDGYSRVDVFISYVLLAGALVLEAVSLCKAILSTWTCSFLYRIGLKMLPDAITYLRWRVCWPARRRLWSGSIGQYNLLHMSVGDRNGIVCWLAKKMGLQHWWNKLRFSDTFLGNEICSVEDLKVLVWREMVTRDTGANSRGSAALQRNNCAIYNWSVNDMDLDRSILVWHIVTDLVIRLPRGEEKVNKRLAEVTKVLSNYMMFLLVVKPDMLPGRTRRNLYLNACKELNCHWSDCLKEWSLMEEAESLRQAEADMLACWLLGDLYHRLQKHDPSLEKIDIEGRGEEAPKYAKDVYNAIWIYESLRSNPHDKVTWLEIIFQVWVEMIMYVAEHCSRDSHARQLSYGGEFITIMWLMVPHLNYYSLCSRI